MSDYERLQMLMARLSELQHRLPAPCERTIYEVARLALEEEIASLGRRLSRSNYWRPPPRLRTA